MKETPKTEGRISRWNYEDLLNDLLINELQIQRSDIEIDLQPMPHETPRCFPKGKMAVYVFSDKKDVLFVGYTRNGSNARYQNQHYYIDGAFTTLAKFLINDDKYKQYGLNEMSTERLKDWIMRNTDRVNFILDNNIGLSAERFKRLVQERLCPIFGKY